MVLQDILEAPTTYTCSSVPFRPDKEAGEVLAEMPSRAGA